VVGAVAVFRFPGLLRRPRYSGCAAPSSSGSLAMTQRRALARFCGRLDGSDGGGRWRALGESPAAGVVACGPRQLWQGGRIPGLLRSVSGQNPCLRAARQPPPPELHCLFLMCI
jgi:hypothetical protein